MRNLQHIVLGLLLCAGIASLALAFLVLSVPRHNNGGPMDTTETLDWRDSLTRSADPDRPPEEPDEPVETSGLHEADDGPVRPAAGSRPDTRADAEALARDSDPVAARAAVSALSAFNDERGADFLADLVFDREVPDTVRMEAALALAKMDSPHALDSLLRATYSDIDSDPGEPVLHAVLRGLAIDHYDQAAPFINQLLAHPDMDAAAKTAALDAMSETPGSEALFALFEQARAGDPDVRESAIWAIAGRDDVHLAGPGLFELLAEESVPWVRASVYEALRYQDSVDVGAIWNTVVEEPTLAARLAGYQTIARHLPASESARFDTEIVPELYTIATENDSLNERLSAIVALGRAKTSEGAVEALLSLRNDGADARVRRAAELALRP